MSVLIVATSCDDIGIGNGNKTGAWFEVRASCCGPTQPWGSDKDENPLTVATRASRFAGYRQPS